MQRRSPGSGLHRRYRRLLGLPEELDEHLTTTVNGQWVVWAHKLARQKGDLFVPLTGGPGYPADARAERRRFRASEALTTSPIRGARAASTPCRAGGSRAARRLLLHGADRGAVRTGAGLRVGRRRSAVAGGAADRGSHRPASPVRSDSRTPGQALAYPEDSRRSPRYRPRRRTSRFGAVRLNLPVSCPVLPVCHDDASWCAGSSTFEHSPAFLVLT